MLSDDEKRDIDLWFGWGKVLNYPTGHKSYLRHAMKHKIEFLKMDRCKRKNILLYIIDRNKSLTPKV